MSESNAGQIIASWIDLEAAMRDALPFCSVAPPTQPAELLAALRVNRSIGAEEEALIRSLREERNRIAHAEQEPTEEEVRAFMEAVSGLTNKLRRGDTACD